MQILIVDFGSQYSLLIARVLRELGVRSAILSPQQAKAWLANNKPKGIILSGSYASVREGEAPQPPQEVFSAGCPILGICYGMQWLAQQFGGVVVSSMEQKEYGSVVTIFDTTDALFSNLGKDSIVWASHGDTVQKMPPGFQSIASSWSSQKAAAISCVEKRIWGLLFHPEVTQTYEGQKILSNFIFSICGCQKDWLPQDIIAKIRSEAVERVGDRRAILGFSGGVDSSTLATIVAPVLGQKLLGVCIDAGNLRAGEINEIKENANSAGIRLKIIKAQGRALAALANTTNAQTKRRVFQTLYGWLLKETAQHFGASVVIQGSLATDFIESGAAGKAALIKSHHNVGLRAGFNEWHPFSEIFKYEVREIAGVLGLPDSIRLRWPFPGPGLLIRVVGVSVTARLLHIVRWADSQVTAILKRCDKYGFLRQDISQLVVALLGIKTVGVKGDARVYGYPVVVRAVRSVDFMTAEGYRLPVEVCQEIESVVTRHPDIVRVVFDATSKPPATIEWE